MKFKLLLFAFCLLCTSAYSQDNIDTSNLIVRFNFKLLDWNLINDVRTLKAPVGDLFTEEGKGYLSEVTTEGFDLTTITAQKIFPQLQTEDSVSISRHGNKVTVPPFWATFTLAIPDGVRYLDFVREMQGLYPLVIYSHPNYLVEFHSPNDSLFPIQSGLWDNGSGYANINVEGAWEFTTGEDFIKVGVFDTGIDSTHEDLKVLTGWSAIQEPIADSTNTYLIFEHWGTDYDNHGTPVAGIIGARRNNDSTGIAGIAGGDGTDSTGVHLLDFRFTGVTGGNIASIEEFSMLIMDAARSPGSYMNWTPEMVQLAIQDDYYNYHYDNAPGFGIYLGNHSYAYRLGFRAKNEDDSTLTGIPGGYFADCNLCIESFLFSLQNGVINVASSGNKLSATGVNPATYDAPNLYPASYDDSWTIRVGASQTQGEVLMGAGYNSNDDFFSIWADNVDVIAPGSPAVVRSTWSTVNSNENPNNERYGFFRATSAAAPHVTGTIALLLSHYNKPCFSNINLDVADIEYILEKSATPTSLNAGGTYSNGAGWGHVDATAAMMMVDYPKYQIVHPIDTFIDRQTISVDTIVVYLEKELNSGSFGPLSASWPLENNRGYKVVRYEEQLTYDFSQYIQDSTELLDAWVRHSQTNSLKFYNDTTVGQFGLIEGENFRVEPMAYIDTIINDSIIKLTGYYYHFIRKYNTPDFQDINIAPQIPENFWYPINPNVDTARMAFSIYLHDSTFTERYDFGCDSINILLDSFAVVNEPSFSDHILIYPNPATTELNVSIGDGFANHGTIKLYDVSGRLIDEKDLSHGKLYTFDIRHLTNGIYFVHLNGGNSKSVTKKWIKQ